MSKGPRKNNSVAPRASLGRARKARFAGKGYSLGKKRNAAGVVQGRSNAGTYFCADPKPGRFLLGILFALSLALCAFIPGMWVGGQVVGDQGGLAGGAIVFFTGLLVSAAAFVAGAVFARILSTRRLKLFTMAAGIPAAIVAMVIGYGYLNSAAVRDAYLDDQIANLGSFTLTLTQTEVVTGRAFAMIEYDTAQTQFTVTKTDGSVCNGTLPAQSRDKVQLLTALRNVEILLADRPAPCADGLVLHRADFRIQEAKPPDTAGSVDMTEACLAEYPQLRAMVMAANAVYEANGCR